MAEYLSVPKGNEEKRDIATIRSLGHSLGGKFLDLGPVSEGKVKWAQRVIPELGSVLSLVETG